MKKLLMPMLCLLLLLLPLASATIRVDKANKNFFDSLGGLFSVISPTQQISLPAEGGNIRLVLLAYPCGSFFTCKANAKIYYPDATGFPDRTFNDILLGDSCDGYACNQLSNPLFFYAGQLGNYRIKVHYDCTMPSSSRTCTIRDEEIWFTASGIQEEQCTTPDLTRCKADVRQICYLGGNAVWTNLNNCDDYGLDCVTEGVGIAHCVNTSSRQTCSQENSFRCDGRQAQKCLQGYWYDWRNCEDLNKQCVMTSGVAMCQTPQPQKKAVGESCTFDDDCLSDYCNVNRLKCEDIPNAPNTPTTPSPPSICVRQKGEDCTANELDGCVCEKGSSCSYTLTDWWKCRDDGSSEQKSDDNGDITVNGTNVKGMDGKIPTYLFSEWKELTPAARIQSVCSVVENCAPYEDVEGNKDYKIKCTQNSFIKSTLDSDYSTQCKSSKLITLGKGLTWLGGASCVGGIVLTAGCAAATGGLCAAAAPITLSGCIATAGLGTLTLTGCSVWGEPDLTKGACIATPKGGADICQYFSWAPNIVGSSCTTGIIIVVLVFIVIVGMLRPK